MNLKSIAGKIVNYNNSFFGEISFDNKIIDISKKKFVDNDSIIIPISLIKKEHNDIFL